MLELFTFPNLVYSISILFGWATWFCSTRKSILILSSVCFFCFAIYFFSYDLWDGAVLYSTTCIFSLVMLRYSSIPIKTQIIIAVLSYVFVFLLYGLYITSFIIAASVALGRFSETQNVLREYWKIQIFSMCFALIYLMMNELWFAFWTTLPELIISIGIMQYKFPKSFPNGRNFVNTVTPV